MKTKVTLFVLMFLGFKAAAQVPYPHTADAHSSAERVASFKVSDASNDFLEITNSTHYPGQFIPSLWGHQEGDSRYSLRVFSSTNSTQDSGSIPLMVFRADIRNSLNLNAPDNYYFPWGEQFSQVKNRPIFGWENGDNQVMRILANGNMGVNTILPTEKFHVKGGVRFENIPIAPLNSNTIDLVVDENGKVYKKRASFVGFNNVSENKIKGALEIIYKLEGKKYTFENDEIKFALEDSSVKSELPTIISDDNEVNYVEIIPILIEALKEQQREIELLKGILNENKVMTKLTDMVNPDVRITNITPNPMGSTSKIYFEGDKEINNFKVLIYNSLGELVKTNEGNADRKQNFTYILNRDSLSSGVYLIVINVNGINLDSERLIIN